MNEARPAARIARIDRAPRRLGVPPICMLIAVALALPVGTGTARAEEKESFGNELSNIEGAISRLSREYTDARADLKTYERNKRLVDGGILFELGQYEAAAVTLLDVMDDPDFRNDPGYANAALTLGKALAELKNYRAARHYFREVLKTDSRTAADEARYHLIDLALTFEEPEELKRLVREVGGVTSERTRYAVGKALLRLEEYQRAADELRNIGPASERYFYARYYVGVALTALKQYDAALEVFRGLSNMQPRGGQDAKARDLSILAVGRLLMERGELDAAIEEYRKIDRHSPSFPVSLYEMAWAFLKKEEYREAMSRVDVLILVVEDEQLDVEAHVLRGRLAVLMNDHESAVDSFERIVGRFAPIKNELNHFARDPENVHKYFEWLLNRHLEGSELMAPLSPKTAAWVESTESMSRMVDVYNWLSEERSEVAEARELANELSRVVGSANRVELFPGLKAGWTKSLVLENQLLALTSRMLDTQYRDTRRTLSPSERRELDEKVTWRHQLEKRVSGMPMTFKQFESRQSETYERFLDLERQSFHIGQTLKELREQILAVEQYLNDAQYGDSDAKKKGAEEEQALRTEIQAEKDRMQAIYDDLQSLQNAIKVASEQIGTGDAVSRGEADFKASLIAMYKKEGLYYDDRGARMSPEVAGTYNAYGRYRERIWTGIDQLRGVVSAIDAKVARKAAEIQKLVEAESQRIEQYALEMRAYEDQGRRTADAIGSDLMGAARERISQVVLEADVGLIDVAWAEKNERTKKLRKVNEERAERLQRLEEEFRPLLEVEAPPAKTEGMP